MKTLLKITHKLNNKHWQVGIFLSICGHANPTLSLSTTLIAKLYCNLSFKKIKVFMSSNVNQNGRYENSDERYGSNP